MAILLGEPDRALPARLVNISGRGMCLRMDTKVAAGVPIRVDMNDTMYLGESCFCEEAPGGGYFLGLRLEQALYDMGTLQTLARQLRKDTEPAGHRPAHGSLRGN